MSSYLFSFHLTAVLVSDHYRFSIYLIALFQEAVLLYLYRLPSAKHVILFAYLVTEQQVQLVDVEDRSKAGQKGHGMGQTKFPAGATVS